MKCAVIIANDIKQIMLSPENDSERMALRLITADDGISIDVKEGTMFDQVPPSALGYVVTESRGNYLRAYEQADAIMLVLRRKSAQQSVERMGESRA